MRNRSIRRHRRPSSQANQVKKAMAKLTHTKYKDRAGRSRFVVTNRSNDTVKNAIKAAIEWLSANDKSFKGIEKLTEKQALRYLENRCQTMSQNTVRADRLAMQKCLTYISGVYRHGGHLPELKALRQKARVDRVYSKEEVTAIIAALPVKYRLSAELNYKCGLRACEIFTLHRIGEGREADERNSQKWTAAVFGDLKGEGRPGIPYLTVGKGNLCRQILIPADLAERLELCRVKKGETHTVKDRGKIYKNVLYNLPAGQALSKAWSRAARKVLGEEAARGKGLHGLRSSYTWERIQELENECLSEAQSEAVVSLELGHFRPDVTCEFYHIKPGSNGKRGRRRSTGHKCRAEKPGLHPLR